MAYQDLEENLAERGVKVDHATLNRWVTKYASQVVDEARRCKRSRPMLVFKSFEAAASTLAGIEVACMIRKGQGNTKFATR